MTDTNDTRREFEAWFSDEGLYPLSVKRSGNSYGLVQAASAWVTWQAATERATALERERCAKVLDALMTSRRRMNSSQKPDCEYVAAIRQGVTHD